MRERESGGGKERDREERMRERERDNVANELNRQKVLNNMAKSIDKSLTRTN